MARYLSSTQCLRGILTFPTVALVVKLPNGFVGRLASQLRLRSVHRPSQQLGASMFWVTPPIVSLIAGRLPTTWRASGAVQVVPKGDSNPSYREGGLPSIPRPFHRFVNTSIMHFQPSNTGGNLRDRSAASFLVVRHTLRLATSNVTSSLLRIIVLDEHSIIRPKP